MDVRRRSKRFYVGGFRSSITHEELIQYVESKGLIVTWVHIWPSKRSDRAVIRLNVDPANRKRFHNVFVWLYRGFVATQRCVNVFITFLIRCGKVVLEPTAGKRCRNV